MTAIVSEQRAPHQDDRCRPEGGSESSEYPRIFQKRKPELITLLLAGGPPAHTLETMTIPELKAEIKRRGGRDTRAKIRKSFRRC